MRTHACRTQEESAKSDKLYLYVDLPRFDLPVLYGEHEYTLPTLPSLVTSSKPAGSVNSTVPVPATPLLKLSDTSIFPVVDPDVARDNPVEAKHLRLVRSHRSGPLDREMKPNAATRDELNVRFIPLYPLGILTDHLRCADYS
jgi:phosphatidylinositol 3-kinase